MKKASWRLIILLAVMAPPLAGEVSGEIALVSRYIWRGFDLLPENKPAVQPYVAVDLGKSGLSVGVWSSFALANWDAYRGADEVDLSLAYSFKMPEGWEATAGFTNYGYWFTPEFTCKNGTSQEFFATLARSDLPLSPKLSVYYDVNLGSGLYATLEGSLTEKLGERLSLAAGALIGFNSRQYIERTGFSDIDLYLRAPLELGRVELTPSFNVMVPLMDEVNEHTEFWFGLTAALGGGD
jgi:hypothetical protein